MQDRVPRPEELEPIERASVDELRALQLDRLRWSLRHAYDNVPQYRKMFDELQVHPDDLRELGDLLGERDEEVASVSYQPGGSILWGAASVQRHTRLRPVLTTNELRTLGHDRTGEVLVIPRAAKAMRTLLPAVWERNPIGVM